VAGYKEGLLFFALLKKDMAAEECDATKALYKLCSLAQKT